MEQQRHHHRHRHEDGLHQSRVPEHVRAAALRPCAPRRLVPRVHVGAVFTSSSRRASSGPSASWRSTGSACAATSAPARSTSRSPTAPCAPPWSACSAPTRCSPMRSRSSAQSRHGSLPVSSEPPTPPSPTTATSWISSMSSWAPLLPACRRGPCPSCAGCRGGAAAGCRGGQGEQHAARRWADLGSGWEAQPLDAGAGRD